MTQTPREKNNEIQVLRALAALAVVFVHACAQADRAFAGGSLGWWLQGPPDLGRIGHFGVDLFFVISGFVMMHVHHDDFQKPNAGRRFLFRRLIRIVPIYWMLTAIRLSLMVAAPQLFSCGDELDLRWVLGSFLFFPVQSIHGIDQPIICYGWTLNFEMFFYLTMAAALSLPRRIAFAGIAAFFASCILLGAVLIPEALWARHFSSWLLLEFLMGGALAWVYRHRCSWLVRLAPLLLGLGVVGIVAADLLMESAISLRRFLSCGTPAVMVVAAAAVSDWSRTPGWRTLLALGEASYSIYLCQVFALPGAALVLRRLGVPALLPLEACVLLLMPIAIVSGLVFCKWVERPITRRLLHAAACTTRQTLTSPPSKHSPQPA